MPKRILLALSALLLAACATTMPPPSTTASIIKHEHWAYIPYWMNQDFQQSGIEKMSHVAVFDLPILSSGKIHNKIGWPDQWHELRKQAKSSSKKIHLVLTMFKAEDFSALFDSPQNIKTLNTELRQLGGGAAIDGVHFDVEIYQPVTPSSIENFRKVVGELKKANAFQYVSAFIPASSAVQIYDQPTLKILDFLVLQGYDAHWVDGPTAGPLAPLDGNFELTWKKLAQKTKTDNLNPQKIFFGFPLYGLEWTVSNKEIQNNKTLGKGAITTFSPLATDKKIDNVIGSVQNRVLTYGMEYHPLSASGHYSFQTKEGEIRQGWFEDAWSLKKKQQFIQEEKYLGFAFWVLGYDRGNLVKQLD